MIVHFETLGCKLNQIESESACKSFSDFGFEITTSPTTASEKYSQKEIEDTLSHWPIETNRDDKTVVFIERE